MQHEEVIRLTNKRIPSYPGQQLTRLNVYGKFNYILFSFVEAAPDGANKYYFTTQTDGQNVARSTEGTLPYKIENNLQLIWELMEKGENEEN